MRLQPRQLPQEQLFRGPAFAQAEGPVAAGPSSGNSPPAAARDSGPVMGLVGNGVILHGVPLMPPPPPAAASCQAKRRGDGAGVPADAKRQRLPEDPPLHGTLL